MSGWLGVDIYDGHFVETILDGDELVHGVIHPPTCELVTTLNDAPDGPFMEHNCAVAFCVGAMGADECFPEATSPGVRVVGWRHDLFSAGWGAVEHDVVCFCLPQDVRPQWEAALGAAYGERATRDRPLTLEDVAMLRVMLDEGSGGPVPLEDVSPTLLAELRSLIDRYGYRGVMQTLEQLEPPTVCPTCGQDPLTGPPCQVH